MFEIVIPLAGLLLFWLKKLTAVAPSKATPEIVNVTLVPRLIVVGDSELSTGPRLAETAPAIKVGGVLAGVPYRTETAPVMNAGGLFGGVP